MNSLKERIINDYEELMNLVNQSIHSVYDCRLWSKKWAIDIMICTENDVQGLCNDRHFDDYELNDAKWIRFDEWGSLSYIYIFLGELQGHDPIFDVYYEDDVAFEEATINDVKNTKAVAYDIDYDMPESDRFLVPETIYVAGGQTDSDDISEYISKVTGYCHKGFKVNYDW